LENQARFDQVRPKRDAALFARHEGEQQFGVVEKFDPKSPYARVHGDTDLQMTGNNAFVLLQNYVESERSVLHFSARTLKPPWKKIFQKSFRGKITAGLCGQFRRVAEAKCRLKAKRKNRPRASRFGCEAALWATSIPCSRIF
jgi:hypothetical protein